MGSRRSGSVFFPMGHPGSAQELGEHLELIRPRTIVQGCLLGTGLIFLNPPVQQRRKA